MTATSSTVTDESADPRAYAFALLRTANTFVRAAVRAERQGLGATAGPHRARAASLRAEARRIGQENVSYACDECELEGIRLAAPRAEIAVLARIHDQLHHGGSPRARIIPA